MDTKSRTYQFSLNAIAGINKLPRDMSSRIIASQLLRAATSIGANVIEAQASPSRKDFVNFFNHSLKSANETIYWLQLLRDACGVDKGTIEPLLDEAKELTNILASSILTLKGARRI